MQIQDFIADLARRNFTLVVENKKLVLKANRNLLSNEAIRAVKEDSQIIDYIRSRREELIKHLSEAENGNGAKKTDNVASIYRLSSLQEGMLFHGLYDEQSESYIMQFCCDLLQPDIAAFTGGWNHLLQRHTILRSAFYYDTFNIPVQCVYHQVKMPVEIIDYRAYQKEEQQQLVAAFEAEDHKKPFSFKEAPLMRVTLLQLDDRRYRMIWTHHHILFDGWSLPILMEEFLDIYESLASGKTPSPVEEDRYEDYIRYVEKLDKEEEEKYWRGYLQGMQQPPLLPFIKTAAHRNKGIGIYKEEALLFDKQASANINDYAQQQRVTVNTIMQGVWAYLLHQYTGSQQVMYGTTVSGRPEDLPGVERRVGMYINTLPLLSVLDKDHNIGDWLRQLQEQQASSRQYQYTALSAIREWTGIEGELFDSIIVFENFPVDEVLGSHQWQLEVSAVQTREHNNFPLSLEIGAGASIGISFSYNAELLDERYVKSIAGHFNHVLTQIITAQAATTGDIKLLTEAEELLLEKTYNDTAHNYPQNSIPELFVKQAAARPNATALVFAQSNVQSGKEQLTYKQLDERSNCIANYLISQGIQPGEHVGLLSYRCTEMIIAMLGILKAGAVYVPFNTSYPASRIKYIMDDAGIKHTVYTNRELFVNSGLPLESGISYASAQDNSTAAPAAATTAEMGAYIMYTSGTTGNPKGILVSHRNIIKLACDPGPLRVYAYDHVMQWSNYSFDGSTFEIYNALLSGACLHIIPEKAVSDTDELAAILRQQHISVWFVTTSLFHAVVDADAFALQGLRRLITGGEQVSASHIAKVFPILGGGKVMNAYGPTETTVFAVMNLIQEVREDGIVPIGRPLANTRVLVLDENRRKVAVGVPGELYIGGHGVANGYVNNEALTKEKFVDLDGSGTWYKTGDFVRWLPDGLIEFLGRRDNQVKIRGYRIELGEIESTLQTAPSVLQSVVLVKEDAHKNKKLIGYIVADNNYNDAIAKEYLSERLPAYMVPDTIVRLEAMPLTPNGKLDRKKLPEPGTAQTPAAHYHSPQNELQQQLAAIFQDLLDMEQVGINENFFDLGGHSLLAIRLMSAIRKDLAKEVSIKDVFDHPTITGLSQRIGDKQSESLLPPLKPRDKAEPAPLSFAQERLWFIDTLQGSRQYHMTWIFRVKGSLNKNALESSFRTIVDRHEILRTVIHEHEGSGTQITLPSGSWQMEYIDQEKIARHPGGIQQLMEEKVLHPFDLSQHQMLRVTLAEQGNEEYVLMIVMHHIAFDGWSISVMVDELVELYSAALENREPELKTPPVQYADYAVWQRSYLSGETLEKKLNYWKNQLQGVTPLELPANHTRPAGQSIRGGVIFKSIPAEIQQSLNALSKKENVTLFMTLLSVFKVLLYRYTGQQDICVGTPVAGRPNHETEGMIGFFVNTLALRNQVHGNQHFTELLQQVRETTLQAYSHQDVPFEKVVEALGVERDLSRTPLFQVTFSLENIPEARDLDLGGVKLYPENKSQVTAQFDISLDVSESAHGLNLAMTYCSDIYDEATIERMLTHYCQLLQSVAADNAMPVNRLPMLSAEELHLLLHDINETDDSHAASKTVVTLFEEQALNFPGSTAVVCEQQSLTYHQLEARANQLAHYLLCRDAGKEKTVGVCLGRTPAMIVTILGILKAGSAYVPVDPSYPAERINYMLSDSDCSMVITTRTLASSISSSWTGSVICIDEIDEILDALPSEAIKARAGITNLAYIIYTSGSTGIPKGVMIEHGCLATLLHSRTRLLNIDRHERILQFYNYSFDVSVEQIFLALCNGAVLVLLPERIQLDAALFQRFLIDERITHFDATPGFVANIQPGAYNLRRVIAGGETCPASLAANWSVHVPFYNAYGPTETTVTATTFLYQADAVNEDGNVPIGKPIENIRAYVLDRDLNAVPEGVAGELVIGGPQVARGYRNNALANAEKFIADPFVDGSRVYRTGDLVKWLPDGNLAYLGRMDEQVKIRGYRVEPGEVERALLQIPGIQQAVVIASADKQLNKRLVAYVVAGDDLNKEDITRYLRSRLPEYMVPGIFIPLAALPLNANGKIDKNRLPSPDDIIQTTGDYTAPRTQLEKDLADIWQQLLGVERIGVHDNFFVLGGHSLLAMRVVSAIRNVLHLEVPVRDIFYHPTIKELAAALTVSTEKELLPPIVSYQRSGSIPLSFAQERLWFIDRLKGSADYQMSWVFRLTGTLNTAALESSFREILRRHEVLRTVIVDEGGAGQQVIMPADAWSMQYADHTELNEASTKEYINAFIQQPYDLSTDLILRVCLLSISPDEHILVTVLHHIAFDGWSLPILVEEFVELYRSAVEQRQPLLKPLPVQYADYSIWQRQYLSGPVLEAKIAYWKQQLDGIEPLILRTDRIRPAELTTKGNIVTRLIGKDINDRLLTLSQQQGTSLFMTLLTVFKILMHRYTGQHDICVGTPVAGRQQVETEGLIGFFNNMLSLRSTVTAETSYKDLLNDVKRITLEAYEHQDVPFEKVVEALGVVRSRSHSPVFQVAFVFQNVPESVNFDLHGVTLSPENFNRHNSLYDLNMDVTETSHGLSISTLYSTDLFNEDTIVRMMEHYEQLVLQVIEDIDIPVEQMTLQPEVDTSFNTEEYAALNGYRTNLQENEKAVENCAPRNEMEQHIAEVWMELLRVENVGIHDNFFELGGDSIITIQVVSRCRRLGYQLQVGDLFSHQTIAALSGVLLERTAAPEVVSDEQGLLTGSCGLLPVQQWYFESKPADASHFNQSVLLSISKQADEELLEQALRQLMMYHDSLRFRYQQTEKGWQQLYGSYIAPLQIENVGEAAEITTISDKYQRSLDIEKGMLVRTVLFKTGEHESYNRLLMIIHHLAVDGVSWRILLEDLELLLQQLHEGKEVGLGKKGSSYRNWYKALESYSQSSELLAQADYWNGVVQHAAPLPVDNNSEASAVQSHTVSLAQELTKQLLQEVPKVYHTEINDTLLAALATTVCRWSNSNQIVVGLEGHGREQLGKEDTTRTTGWFTSLYPVKLEVDAETKEVSGALIKSIKEQLRKVPGKGLGYGVLKYINKEATLQGKDPWDIVFNYLGQTDNVASSSEWFSGAAESAGENISSRNVAKEKISVTSIVTGGQLFVSWSYDNANYNNQTIQQLAADYIHQLHLLIMHCIEQAKHGSVFTPSDFRLGSVIGWRVFDTFMQEKINGHTRAGMIENIYRLSGLQEGMLFHGLYNEQQSYINQFSCNLVSPDINAFTESWNYLIAKHSILRTAFYHDTFAIPVQCVYKKISMPVEIVDYDESDADKLKGFDFSEAPLMRVSLQRLSGDTYRMVWTYHHIILDGWSMPVLMEEFLKVYEAIVNKTPLPQYAEDKFEDYIRHIETNTLEQERQYWQQYLAGVEEGSLLPFINTMDRTTGIGRYETLSLLLDEGITTPVQAYAQQNHITINTLMQGIWSWLLSKYTGSDSVVYGIIVSGRPEGLAEVERRVGLYINTIPFHTVIEKEKTVSDWLQQLQQQQAASQKFQYTALSNVRTWTGVTGDLFDTLVVFENYPVDEVIASKDWTLQVQGVQSKEHNNYPLSLEIGAGKVINICFNYNSKLLSGVYVKNISDHFSYLLQQIINTPQCTLGALRLLPATAEKQLKEQFNDTASDYPSDKTITQIFSEQVLQTPLATALVFITENSGEAVLSYSYRELDNCANQLANYLIKAGIRPGSPVPICLDRSDSLVIAILGILKAGGVYVPVDPAYPEQRVAYMLQDIGASFVISRSDINITLPAGIRQVAIDREWTMISHQPANAPVVDLNASSLAYIMYTSGSTGTPKGVMVEHGNVVSLVKGISYVELTDKTVQLSTGSPSFDATTLEYWGTLLNGGRLVLCSHEALFDTHRLQSIIENQKINTMWFTAGWFNQLAETSISLFEPLQTVIAGGDRLSARHIAMVKERYPHLRVVNGYGPTENTTFSLTYDIKQIITGAEIPIGTPLENRTAYILDDTLQLCAIGVPGEICVGGAGLSKGYWNQEAFTAARFRYVEGIGRVYCTGDLGRWLPDGIIEFLGRKDDQVKIRGYRVEPGEIENVLQQAPGVHQAVVIAKNDDDNNKKLVAYIVGEAIDKTEIITFLQSRLPDYMIPVVLMQVENIPLTANGKVDKKQLPDAGISQQRENKYQPPRNETEKQLAEIWEELLGIEGIGIHDNFFELGGHSLLAIRLIAAIRSRFNQEVGIREAFDHATIAQMAGLIAAGNKTAVLPGIPCYNRPERIPLSFAQERLWFIDRLQGSVQYHMPWAFRLHGALDVTALESSFREIVLRHEVLRTQLHDEDGSPYQVITPAYTWRMDYCNERAIAEDEVLLHKFIDEYIDRPFDLSSDHLLRVLLVRIHESQHVLLVVFHHIAFDGWSISIMVQELTALYRSKITGQPPLLKQLPIQYADYAMWQRQYLSDDALASKLAYWKNQLQDTVPLSLPHDYAPSATLNLDGAVANSLIDKQTSEAIAAVSNREGTTLFITLLAAFKLLLYRYTGQTDICVGTPVAGRHHQETEGLIGFFINSLALRTHVQQHHSFKTLLQQVKQTTLNAYEHQDVPFEKVVEASVVDRNLARNPLYQVIFSVLNVPKSGNLDLGGLELVPEHSGKAMVKLDITFDVIETGEGLHLSVLYNRSLFAPNTINRMLDHYKYVLQQVTNNVNINVNSVSLITPEEEQKILHEFNKPASVTHGLQTVIHLFEEQALRIPQAVALVCGSRSLTYQQLDQHAAHLAAHLSYLGLGPESLLPICMERSAELVIAILAAWKAGAAYVPIDPAYPAERIHYILDDTKAGVIVTTSSLRHLMPVQIDTVCIDEVIADHKQQSLKAASPHNLAYVIYTSGSTGKPKGVMVEHASLLNYALNCKELYVDENNKGAGSFMHLSFTFDASLTALTVPLLSGKYIVIGTQQGVAVFEDEQLQQHAPYDFIKLTPAHLPLLEGIIDKDPLRYVTRKLVVGGEALQPNHFSYLTRNEAPVEIINEYGPTEATVGCSVWHVYTDKPVEVTGNGISIGHPMNNTTLYITDGNSLAPIGVAGELCIGGIQVARGYLNQPELTAERFVDDPFSTQGGKLYRTGDMSRWLPDGRIEYLGRRDDQVKIRGYRIETGEVENVLQRAPGVQQAVVIAKENNDGTKQLVAFIVAKNEISKDAVNSYLATQLPDYMIPSLIVPVTEIPLTVNGKVDRRQLLSLAGTPSHDAAAPRDEVEQKLAGIWKDLLGLEQVGIYDSFFELGGHSLLIMRVVAAVREELDAEIPLDTFFELTTIESIARYIRLNQNNTVTALEDYEEIRL
jgi:amino acid adenylation domain-containing protein/non-ribosomal peptide synthase protein (TIGR01720 family)